MAGGRDSRECEIHGAVAPGFEPVRALYERRMRVLAEYDTQLCVYHRGQRVVDLWSSKSRRRSFSPDSLVGVFSSGKSLEAIAIAALVGRGLINYDAKISDYWPEFAAAGKEELTVAELMRHEAGIAALRISLRPKDLLAENLRQNRVGSIIEEHPQRYRKGGRSRREYHAITRGWIVNELFRRVDPEGRTIGEFLEEEIRRPLEADAIVGVREKDLGRVAKVRPLGIGYQLGQSLRPRRFGRGIEHSSAQLAGRLGRIIPLARHSTSRGAPPPYVGMRNIGFFNERAIVMGESPSANANCSARGLAKVAAMMAARGAFQGRQILSEDAWEALHAHPLEAEMGFAHTRFTQGGVNLFTAEAAARNGLERAFNLGREGFYGWMGLGGSIFQWHPEEEIGLAFVPTALHLLDFFNERGKAYQAEVLRCVAAVKR